MKEILQAINNVMKDVGYVKKNAAVQGYKAVSHDDVTAALRGSMVENGLMFTISINESNIFEAGKTKSGATIWFYSAKYTATIHHVSGESISSNVEAHAMDHGDKASGKALSYATKYFLLKSYMLEAGENDESRQEVIEAIKEAEDFNKSKMIAEINRLADAANKSVMDGCKFVSGGKHDDLDELSNKQLNTLLNNYRKQVKTND